MAGPHPQRRPGLAVEHCVRQLHANQRPALALHAHHTARPPSAHRCSAAQQLRQQSFEQTSGRVVHEHAFHHALASPAIIWQWPTRLHSRRWICRQAAGHQEARLICTHAPHRASFQPEQQLKVLQQANEHVCHVQTQRGERAALPAPQVHQQPTREDARSAVEATLVRVQRGRIKPLQHTTHQLRSPLQQVTPRLHQVVADHRLEHVDQPLRVKHHAIAQHGVVIVPHQHAQIVREPSCHREATLVLLRPPKPRRSTQHLERRPWHQRQLACSHQTSALRATRLLQLHVRRRQRLAHVAEPSRVQQ
mmetsp:Transcript_9983/g.31442  ORF Transcript_9983/g.31442 Transcript_9983/m.31442 type:complete len:307 (-) Transcript_9983:1210-2130(-)